MHTNQGALQEKSRLFRGGFKERVDAWNKPHKFLYGQRGEDFRRILSLSKTISSH
jgi:hypothetical protein